MSNPARELHEIFRAWRGLIAPNGSVPARVFSPTPGSEHTDSLQHAYRLITRLRTVLTGLESQGHEGLGLFNRQIDEWSKVPVSMGATTAIRPGVLISDTLLQQIEGFALFLDGKVPVIALEHQERLSEVVARARTLVEDDDELDINLRRYIHTLLAEIDLALSNDRVGKSFDFAEAAMRLRTAFGAAATESPDNGARWRNLLASIGINTAASALVGTGQTMLEILV